MPTLLWRLAIMASIILLTPSCQTTSAPLPKDGPDIVAEAVAEAKAEWCRGQLPAEFSQPEFDAAPQWVRDYITGNNDQWLKGGCKA